MVQDLALSYDANDRVSTITDGLDPARNQVFGYDEVWRLEQALGPYGTIDYGYDAVGNRLSRTVTASAPTAETYAYDPESSRLLSVTGGAAPRSFGYAADGSVTSDDRGADDYTFAYDAPSRLAGVEKNGAPEAAYAYDAFGRRVLKDLAATAGATHFVYDPDGRLLAESSETGVPEREYIWLPFDGQPLARPLAFVTDAGTASPLLHYLHTDHLGTPVAMTSAGLAQLEWSATYRPFGEAHLITGMQDLALRFPGQLLDPETGFHQNWQRDYDPRLGRYLQSDLIGLAGGPNTYAYVGSNPVNLIDPSGTVPLAIPAIVACLADPLCAAPLVGAAAYAVHACKVTWDRFFNEDSSDPDDNRTPAPALEGDPYHPKSVDKRRSQRRKQMGAPSIDPDSPIPDQGPGRDMGGHEAKSTPHHPGQRNIGAGGEEHSRTPKGAPKVH